MKNYFYCYSYRLMYFIKSNGVCYVRYGFNKNNGLKYFMFQRCKRLDCILDQWNELKAKEKLNEL